MRVSLIITSRRLRKVLFKTREGLLDVIGGKVPVFDDVGTNISSTPRDIRTFVTFCSFWTQNVGAKSIDFYHGHALPAT